MSVGICVGMCTCASACLYIVLPSLEQGPWKLCQGPEVNFALCHLVVLPALVATQTSSCPLCNLDLEKGRGYGIGNEGCHVIC
jgi:hypothetical protein